MLKFASELGAISAKHARCVYVFIFIMCESATRSGACHAKSASLAVSKMAIRPGAALSIAASLRWVSKSAPITRASKSVFAGNSSLLSANGSTSRVVVHAPNTCAGGTKLAWYCWVYIQAILAVSAVRELVAFVSLDAQRYTRHPVCNSAKTGTSVSLLSWHFRHPPPFLLLLLSY